MADDSGGQGFDQLREWMRNGALRTTMSLEQIDECIVETDRHILALEDLRLLSADWVNANSGSASTRRS